MTDSVARHLDLGSVGHDSGRLVLRLGRRLCLPSAQVRQALTASGRPDTPLSSELLGGGERVERWEVEDECPGSRLSFTAWIDAEDLETAAGTGAEHHQDFERLVRVIERGTARGRSDDVDLAPLVEEYRSAFATALADTD